MQTMNKFYFNPETEEFSVKKKSNVQQVRTYKSLIDCMNSYHYYKLQEGLSVEDALQKAIK